MAPLCSLFLVGWRMIVPFDFLVQQLTLKARVAVHPVDHGDDVGVARLIIDHVEGICFTDGHCHVTEPI